MHGRRALLVLFSILIEACSGGGSFSDPPLEGPLCLPPGDRHTSGETVLVRVFPEVQAESLIGLEWEPQGDGFVLLDQRGRLVRYDSEGDQPVEILDWRDRVLDPWGPDHGEAGLIGFALHPNWPDDGRVWISAVLNEGVPEQCPLQIIAELHRGSEGTDLHLDPEPFRILFERRNNCWRAEDGNVHPVHHGGTLRFDPEDPGRLIVGLGEMNRPEEAGRPDSAEGTFLALYVDQPGSSPLLGVEVPADVLAWGFRNPWQWSFDRSTGAIWVGDVGGRRFEEIDLLEEGSHHGWPVVEAAACSTPPCDLGRYQPPEYWYDRGGGCAVIGGFVYRGNKWPDLDGIYLFSDFCNGRISGLFPTADGTAQERLLAHTELPITSFAQDPDGEIYVLSARGPIFRLENYHADEDPTLPATLSQTGCGPDNGAAMLAYGVNIPLWSDGATKRRWLSLPPGATIDIGEHGDLDFPPGTVFAKEFSISGNPIETRLLSRHADGGWNGLSYAWDEDGRTAELVGSSGATRVIEGLSDSAWRFPGRQECLRCHSSSAGRTLGAELAQLRPTEGGPDPVEELIGLGALEPNLARRLRAEVQFPRWSGVEQNVEEEEEEAIGGYLHANCSFCHAPEGIARTDIDLRFPHWPENAGLCGEDVEFGVIPVEGLLRLAPGDAERSALWWRMTDTGEHRMPPLATSMVDQHAAARLQNWIDKMDGCPETTSRPASVNRHAAAPATALLAERATYEAR